MDSLHISKMFRLYRCSYLSEILLASVGGQRGKTASSQPCYQGGGVSGGTWAKMWLQEQCSLSLSQQVWRQGWGGRGRGACRSFQ